MNRAFTYLGMVYIKIKRIAAYLDYTSIPFCELSKWNSDLPKEELMTTIKKTKMASTASEVSSLISFRKASEVHFIDTFSPSSCSIGTTYYYTLGGTHSK